MRLKNNHGRLVAWIIPACYIIDLLGRFHYSSMKHFTAAIYLFQSTSKRMDCSYLFLRDQGVLLGCHTDTECFEVSATTSLGHLRSVYTILLPLCILIFEIP
jgi:hypothetical protein